jgi:hypothetical protein
VPKLVVKRLAVVLLTQANFVELVDRQTPAKILKRGARSSKNNILKHVDFSGLGRVWGGMIAKREPAWSLGETRIAAFYQPTLLGHPYEVNLQIALGSLRAGAIGNSHVIVAPCVAL